MNDYLKIITYYGVNNQQRKLAEECFELQEAITEYELVSNNKVLFSDFYIGKCHEHIAEELADVSLLLNQFKHYYNISNEELCKIMQAKIDRVFARIEKENS